MVDESFNSIIDGIFNYDSKNKVKINFWNIPGIRKAKKFKDLSEQKREIYSIIAEKMRELKSDDNFYEIYDYLGRKYRETYIVAKKVVEENKQNKIKKEKRKEIIDKIEEYSKSSSENSIINELLKELRDLE